jgi:beta-galactosidase
MLFAQPTSKPSDKIHWDSRSFVIHNRPLILFGGSMPYFRVPEPEWEPALRRIAADGFNLIDTYVPWSLHEPEEGRFDFDELQRFLDLATKYDLYVVARPGPYLCSEFDQGEFPRWLSGKDVGFRTNSDTSRGIGPNTGTTR